MQKNWYANNNAETQEIWKIKAIWFLQKFIHSLPITESSITKIPDKEFKSIFFKMINEGGRNCEDHG
jgi:hypothetical protein